MPEPIRQEIKTDYDGKGVEAAARDLKDHGTATDRLKNELRQLTLEQSNYSAKLNQGTKLTSEETRAANQRRARIDQLTRSIARQEDEQVKLNAETRRMISTHRQYDEQGRETNTVLGKLRSGFGSMTTAISGVVGGLIGVGGLQQAFQTAMRIAEESTQAANQALKEHIKLAQDANRATLDLHALNLKFSPEDEAAIGRFQELSGRDRSEIAPSFTAFKSATAYLTPEEQREQYEQRVLIPSLATTGSIQASTKLASRISNTIEDPIEQRNLTALAVKAAGEGDPSAFFEALAKLLPVAIGAGVDPSDAIALLSVLSRDLDAAQAGTALEQILNKSYADQNAGKIYKQLGVADSDIFTKLSALREANLDPSELAKLSNPEHLGKLQSLIGPRYEQLQTVRGELGEYANGDIYGDLLQDLYTKSPNAKYYQIGAQQSQKINVQHESDQTLGRNYAARQSLSDILTEQVKAGQLDQRSMDNRLERYDELVAMGHDAVDAIEYIEGPGRSVPGRGTKVGNRATYLGTTSFAGIKEEVSRRLAVGVQGANGQSYGGIPGAENLESLPIMVEYPHSVRQPGTSGYEGLLKGDEYDEYMQGLNQSFEASSLERNTTRPNIIINNNGTTINQGRDYRTGDITDKDPR